MTRLALIRQRHRTLRKRATRRAYRERQRERGLCRDCAAPATEGMRCGYHAEKAREAARRAL